MSSARPLIENYPWGHVYTLNYLQWIAHLKFRRDPTDKQILLVLVHDHPIDTNKDPLIILEYSMMEYPNNFIQRRS